MPYLFFQFDCCGYESVNDWNETNFFEETEMFPGSCNCSDDAIMQLDPEVVSSLSLSLSRHVLYL